MSRLCCIYVIVYTVRPLCFFSGLDEKKINNVMNIKPIIAKVNGGDKKNIAQISGKVSEDNEIKIFLAI